MTFASKSVPRHLIRGTIGFGSIVAAVALIPVVGLLSLLLLPLALVAFRGCPTCWVIGLLETISHGKLHRTCTDNQCSLRVS
jgi:hypothetical protein